MLGLSVDNNPSLKAFAAGLGGVPHPLLSDFHPKGAVLASYGVYNEESGNARRSLFIIDKSGVIRYAQIYAPGTLPDPAHVLSELEGLA